MPITFGSVGDIISLSLLIKDILKALSDTNGSAAEYQGFAGELLVLDTVLLQIEQLARTQTTTPRTEALWLIANQTAGKCRERLDAVNAEITKFDKTLSKNSPANMMQKSAGRCNGVS
jgi:hypothetical protein